MAYVPHVCYHVIILLAYFQLNKNLIKIPANAENQ